ncbi:uncharacterized protein LOC133290108 [Gastrolobium bilobum]|nr:uncharacterized protein LOC133290108 [Gastrolobium bilobum]
MMVLGLILYSVLDLAVAGVSLMVGLWFFSFITFVLSSVAFLHNSKYVS